MYESRSFSLKMKRVSVILGVLAFCILVFLGRMAEYIVSEYVTCSHVYHNPTCVKCRDTNHTNFGRIPQSIHQIFFFETSDTIPEKLETARRTWLAHHPGYKYTLWNKTSINGLIDAHYPEVRRMYDSYAHWVMRADVARYLVLHKYGGWYVDMDVACKKR